MNGQVVYGRRTLLSSKQAGVCLPVDDTRTFRATSCIMSTDNMMHKMADIVNAMADVGFMVPDQVFSRDVVKVIGYGRFSSKLYVRWQHNAALRLHIKRRLGSSGAQLWREVYSAPFVIYKFSGAFDGQTGRPWPSARCARTV